MDAETRLHHDIVVIGGSAGALEALEALLAALPRDLAAAIFVVVHVGATSRLTHILSKLSPLEVREARSGEEIQRSTILVAPAGYHLLLHDNHTLLRRGPRENMARPAIDPLFRSTASSFGSRVIGVILSGGLNDGTAGLSAIKSCGGLALAQLPEEAADPDMPSSAIKAVSMDGVAKASELGSLLVRLVATPAGPQPPIPLNVQLEAAIAAQELSDMHTTETIGTRSPFTCPECHGALWEIRDSSILRYRCHVGHAYTAEAMMSARAVEIESTLWILLRSHEERAALARRMAEQLRHSNAPLAAKLERRSRDYEDDAQIMRNLIDQGGAEQRSNQ